MEAVVIEHKSGGAGRFDNVGTTHSGLTAASESSPSHLNHGKANSHCPRLSSESRFTPELPAVSLTRRQTHPAASSVRNLHTGCLISLCRNPRCRLQTHNHDHNPRKRHGSITKLPVRSPSSSSKISSNKSTPREDVSIQRLCSPTLDGSHSLPKLLVDAFDESELWVLYRTFYTRDFKHMNAILSPPPFTEAEKAKILISTTESARVTISDALYCLNVICLTFLQNLSREQPFMPDRFFSQLHGKALHLFRAKLSNFASDEVDQLITVIFMLARVDLACGNLKMMESHRQILNHLVLSRGGPYNFHFRTVPMLVELDLIIATCVGSEPLFSLRIDRSFQSSRRHPVVYGLGLESLLPRCDCDQNVNNYCQDLCRAVEIMETENWVFNSDERERDVNVANIFYFYFLKNRLSVESAHLQAWDFSVAPHSRPVLLAASIVAYLTLQDGYVIHFALVLADLLKTALELQNLRKDWVGKQEVLRWILCVTFSIPVEWTGRTWAFSIFQKILDRTYAHAFWPPNWAAVEVQNARRFVWSDTRLTEALLVNFRKLELTRRKPLQSDVADRLDGRPRHISLNRCQSDLGSLGNKRR